MVERRRTLVFFGSSTRADVDHQDQTDVVRKQIFVRRKRRA